MLQVTAKLALHGCRFGSKVENPSCNEAAQDWYVGYDDCHAILNMVDTIVDRVGPIGVEQSVEAVAIR
jgi:hypothetical protein